MGNADLVADHCLTLDQALTQADKGAFLPIRKRDLFHLDPQHTLLGKWNIAYQSLIFLECSPEYLDLESIIGNLVDSTTKESAINAVNQFLANNQDKV